MIDSVSKDLRFVSILQEKDSTYMLLTILHEPSEQERNVSITPWHERNQIKNIIKKEFGELLTNKGHNLQRPRNTYDLETFVTMETGDGHKVTLTRRPKLFVIEVDKKIVLRLNNQEAKNFRKIVNTLADIQMGVGQIK